MTLLQKTIHSVGELDGFVAELEKHITKRTILLLEGEVGVGKTETVRALARRRGWQQTASPSFAIHLRYESLNGDGADHVDLYRIKNEDDLESTGFWDLFSDEAGLIIIEWPEKMNQGHLPNNWTRLKVNYTKGKNPDHRHLILTKI